MTGQLSLMKLVMDASPPVMAVMLLLLLCSVVSWYIIVLKHSLLRRTQREADWFEDQFWSGGNLAAIYQAVISRDTGDFGLQGLFRAGFDELSRQRQNKRSLPDDVLASVQRAMRAALVREVDRLEAGLAPLATIGSTSPYIGLFGTVWGIMVAFIALGNVQQATLAMVAPGIAEALIATAMGLFAAIPAVIAYNAFTSRVDRLENRYNAFMEEFAGIVVRGVSREPIKAAAT